MLRDPDPMVVTNCIAVLNELMLASGGMAVNRPIMLHLLNRLGDFTEFGLGEVLGLLARYTPADNDEIFSIMNLLDPVLRTSNSGSVLATIKCFLHLTKNMPQLQPQIYGRIKPPLLTLIAGGIPELVYCLLKHVDFLVSTSPGSFDDEYRQFYVRYNDPSHVKYMKCQILAKLANTNNALDIISELSEYVSDIDGRLGKLAIKSIGEVACTSRCCASPVAETVVEKLVELCSLDVGHVSAAAAATLRDVLRKHPNQRDVVAPVLCGCLKFIEDGDGKAAIIWMLGEVGEVVVEAPYVLEKTIANYDEHPSPVKLALLHASMKLFFKRPGEMQRILGNLITLATNDVADQDLHDRALYYYRLLQTGPENAERVINATATTIDISKDFAEDDESEVRAGLANEFNTLSICYGKTAEHFVADENRVRQGDAQADAAAAAIADMGIAAPAPAPAPVATSDSQGNAAYDDLLGFASGGEVGAATGAALGGAGEVDLLGGFGGEVGGGGGGRGGGGRRHEARSHRIGGRPDVRARERSSDASASASEASGRASEASANEVLLRASGVCCCPALLGSLAQAECAAARRCWARSRKQGPACRC
jgi:vesicle coat complex subunit